jgi:hypothetical protein
VAWRQGCHGKERGCREQAERERQHLIRAYLDERQRVLDSVDKDAGRVEAIDEQLQLLGHKDES